MAIVDGNDNPVFVYTLPAGTGSVAILSSYQIYTGKTYTLKTGVTVAEGSGIRFHNLYTTLPTISGGTTSSISFTTTTSNYVYSNVSRRR